MSDSSDSDGSLTNTFRTMVSATGPNINWDNITGLFSNKNVFTSTQYEPQIYAYSNYDQRSISNRGERSPASVRSSHYRRQRNFSYSYNRQKMGVARSMRNSRSQSPMSICGSIASTASEYVLHATQVLQDGHLNDDEMDILEEACFKFLNKKRKIKKIYATTSNSSQRSVPTSSNMPTISHMFKKPPPPVTTQNGRFKIACTLPAQRFHRSIITTSIQEIEKEQHGRNFQDGYLHTNKNSERNNETESDEEIFSNTTNQNLRNNRKRSIDSEDLFLPNTKRVKSCNNLKTQKNMPSDGNAKDFVFAKPTCPARKFDKDKLISKSAAPLTDVIPEISVVPLGNEKPKEKPEEFEDDQLNSTENSTSLSMRPSFIKRKLYTQTLDSEKANRSIDNMDSPQKDHSVVQKEKHKTRKLQQATTQSCLSRDIEQDESNLLDLIQKIVPIDQMNMTNHTNKTTSHSKNMTEEDDKWDGPSTISLNKDVDNESETFTDEEMLNHTVKELQKEEAANKHTVKSKNKISTPKKTIKTKTIAVVVEKLPDNITQQKFKQIQHFWDTDFETDDEISDRTDKTKSKEIHKPGNVQTKEAPMRRESSNLFNSKKSTTSIFNPSSTSYTFDPAQKFNTFRIRCHKPLKRNKIFRITDEIVESTIQLSENNQKKTPENSSPKVSNMHTETIRNVEDNKTNKTSTLKKKTEKSPKGKKSSAKTDNLTKMVPKSDSKKLTKTEDNTTKIKINSKKKQKENLNSNKHHTLENNEPTEQQPNSKEKPVESKVSRDKSSNAKEKTTLTKKTSHSKENNEQTEQQLNSKEKPVESKVSRDKSSNAKEKTTLTKKTSHSKENNTSTKNQPNSKEYNEPTKKESNCIEYNASSKKQLNYKENNAPNKTQLNSKENNALAKIQTKEKLVDSKTSRTKSTNTKKITQENNSSVMEENNNKASRAVRTCRTNSFYQSAEKSILAQNDSMNRTLRPRNKLNSMLNNNNTKVGVKRSKSNLARLSDVSFSLDAEKDTVTKKAVIKIDSSLLNTDESNVTFSLSPSPKKTSAYTNRNKLMNYTPLRQIPARMKKDIRDLKPIKLTRNRTPVKRYMCC